MPVINVNGSDLTVDAVPDMPLLWVIRDILGYTGTKYGCGIGVCGACTVHVDGGAEQSCQLTVSSVLGKKVVTIEGLSKDGSHPLQKAWQEHDVPQCGYCQSGPIMAAAALLARKPDPTDADIDDNMSLHICRCGTYTRIKDAIKSAAKAGAK